MRSSRPARRLAARAARRPRVQELPRRRWQAARVGAVAQEAQVGAAHGLVGLARVELEARDLVGRAAVGRAVDADLHHEQRHVVLGVQVPQARAQHARATSPTSAPPSSAAATARQRPSLLMTSKTPSQARIRRSPARSSAP